jgi:hypothetical protein
MKNHRFRLMLHWIIVTTVFVGLYICLKDFVVPKMMVCIDMGQSCTSDVFPFFTSWLWYIPICILYPVSLVWMLTSHEVKDFFNNDPEGTWFWSFICGVLCFGMIFFGLYPIIAWTTYAALYFALGFLCRVFRQMHMPALSATIGFSVPYFITFLYHARQLSGIFDGLVIGTVFFTAFSIGWTLAFLCKRYFWPWLMVKA